MNYKVYDWDGKKLAENIDNLKDAVREALKLGGEICDENNDIIFSQWDGWNGDYPNIEKLCFPIADQEMIEKAKKFIEETGSFNDWCSLQTSQFHKWIGREWLHSDRWSAVYDWVNDGRFANVDLPEDIIECLVEDWETHGIHVKFGV